MNFSRSITFAAGLAVLGSAYAGWNRLPFVDARPIDLAASAIPGTKVVSSVGLANVETLIGSNVNEAVTLAAGRSSAVIQLNGQQNIHTIVFNNDGAEGRITIGGSVDNRDWSGLGSAVFGSADRVAQVHFAAATVKYLSLNFESAKGGSIRAFEVFGTSTERDFKLMARESGGLPVNLASVAGGARPIFAFPTPLGVGELSHIHNVFQFPKSNDKFRTIVYDLGASRTLDHFATTHSLRPVRVEVFAFDKLPEKEDWRGKLTLDPTIFNTLKPVAVGEDNKGAGHVTITPDKPIVANYIALRFEPNYQFNDAVAASSIGTQNLIATAGPLGSVLGGLGLLPEFRFTKGPGAANDDLMVGSIELRSNNGFEVAPNVGDNVPAYAPPALPSKKANDTVAVYSSAAAPAQAGGAPSKGDSRNDAAAVIAPAAPILVAANKAGGIAASSAPYVSGQSSGASTQLLQTFSSVGESDSNADKNKEIDAMYNAAVKAAEAERKAAQDAAKAAKDAVYHTPGVTDAQKKAADAAFDAANKAADATYNAEKAAAEQAKKDAHDMDNPKGPPGDPKGGDHGDHGDHGPPHTPK